MEERPHSSEFGQQTCAYVPEQPGPPSTGRGRARAGRLVVAGVAGFFVVVAGVVAAVGKHSAAAGAGTTTANSTGPGAAAGAVPAASAGPAAQATTPAGQADAAASAPAGQNVVFSCTGQAGNGITITYGPEGSSFGASSLPFSKTLPLNSGAQFYVIDAQLQGSGSVSCSTVVSYQDSDGASHTVAQSAAASSGYNIASAEVCSDFTGGWQDC
ncbi:MAG TPA: hypothetical protein VGX23_29845 [Actinocrinis sp.]|nr:hypothetical protein [Actinocrinis sp.]